MVVPQVEVEEDRPDLSYYETAREQHNQASDRLNMGESSNGPPDSCPFPACDN